MSKSGKAAEAWKENYYTAANERDNLRRRLEIAERLLAWWDGSNPGEDYHTKLAVDTRAFLAGEPVDVPAHSRGGER